MVPRFIPKQAPITQRIAKTSALAALVVSQVIIQVVAHVNAWVISGQRMRSALAIILIVWVGCSGCLVSNDDQPYYGSVAVHTAQEFRWSDGGLPRVLDPAFAAAAPDTDAVRALFEGLTEYDPQSLQPVPAVAASWESSIDNRTWTFHLRKNARWSNGDAVTAEDFVRSWQRVLRLGDRAPHAKLLANVEGISQSTSTDNATEPGKALAAPDATEREAAKRGRKTIHRQKAVPIPVFGAEAISERVLRVRLQRPDKNFPALVAHTVFRPVHGVAAEDYPADPISSKSKERAAGFATEIGKKVGSETDATSAVAAAPAAAAPSSVVSNGAFQLSTVADDRVVLVRAANYWDVATVELERVRFVETQDAEAALSAYRAGEVDAVTNAAFEPLALKLLASYKDFRRATFGALVYYGFNTSRAPFDDRRVREALAIAIDRSRLIEDKMDGATEPAQKFLPPQTTSSATKAEQAEQVSELSSDPDHARALLAAAGYAKGRGFPVIKLLVNANDQQRILAQAVAAMWRSVLGIETEIIARSWDEYEADLQRGEYDVARRSIVMQTTDETTNLLAMFDHTMFDHTTHSLVSSGTTAEEEAEPDSHTPDATQAASLLQQPLTTISSEAAVQANAPSSGVRKTLPPKLFLTEAQALRDLPAMPIYFASSHALVKPYVVGFATNLLDIALLKRVRINTQWQPPPAPPAVVVIERRNS